MSFNPSQGFGSIGIIASASQTFNDGTGPVVVFGTQNFATGITLTGGALFTFDNANDRITVNQTGTYLVAVVGPGFSAQTVGATRRVLCNLDLRVAASPVSQSAMTFINSAGTTDTAYIQNTLSQILQLTSGDNVDCTFIQTSGNNWASDNTTNYSARLMITQLAKAL